VKYPSTLIEKLSALISGWGGYPYQSYLIVVYCTFNGVPFSYSLSKKYIVKPSAALSSSYPYIPSQLKSSLLGSGTLVALIFFSTTKI
jgi:hypothetical protein